MSQQCQRILWWALLVQLVAFCLLLPSGIFAQQSMIDWNDRRLTMLENQNIDARLRVLESDVFEVKWMGRAVAAAVIGQFVLAGFGIRQITRRG